MQSETFKSQREFNNKFPSKMFNCSNCGALTADKYTCQKCGWRADGLLQTMGKGFIYTIENINFTEEIFRPIELLTESEEENEQAGIKRKYRKS